LKSRNLIFFTAEFPYGTGETFIENEFPFLAQYFDKIIIITNKPETKNKRTILTNNVKVIHFPYELSPTDKIKSLQGVFSKMFWQEIKIIRNQYKLRLKLSILKTLLTSIQKKKTIANYVFSYIENKGNTWLYSYWLNDMAIGIAELKNRMPNLKAFSRAHGWDLYLERHPDNYLPLRNFILTHSDACYNISNHGKSYLDKLTNNKYAQKIKLSKLGTLNKNKIPPFITNQKLHLVSCSNLIPLKRIHLIIEALCLLDIPINWTHIGSGVLQQELEELARLKLSNKQNITYNFTGQLSNKEVLNFYSTQHINLFINVSISEGLPVSIMEAMSFGIPVIATNVGGNTEIVSPENGFLLSSNPTACEIKDTINFFAEMSIEKYSKYRINARKTWEENYNAEINYTQFIADL